MSGEWLIEDGEVCEWVLFFFFFFKCVGSIVVQHISNQKLYNIVTGM